MQAAAVLLVAFLIWAGCYVHLHGFGRKWRKFVSTEFSKRGVELTMRRLTLDPFQGIVAREVRVKDPNRRDATLAVIDEVVLDINYANLLNGEPFLNAIGLSDAQLALPLDPADKESPRIEIGRLSAHILLPPGQVHVRHLEADLYGIQVFASGRILNPERLRDGSKPKGDPGAMRRMVKRVIDEIGELRFASAPRIEVRFTGDAAAPAEIFVEGSVWAPRVERSGYQAENVFATATWKEGVLQMSRCSVSDAKGALELTGGFQPANGRADFQLRSTLDLPALAKSAGVKREAIDELVFYGPPVVDCTGRVQLGAKPSIAVLGRAEVPRFTYRSVMFEGLSGDFSWRGDRWYVRDLHLQHQTGAVSATAMQLPGDFRARVQSGINPRALLPLTTGKAAETLGQLEFQESPQLYVEVRGRSPRIEDCTVTGTVELGPMQMRGVPLLRATSAVRFADKALSYENFRVERSEGVGTGTFTYDFGTKEVRLDGIQSTLMPVDVLTWIDRRIARDLAPYRFKGPPNVTVQGKVQTTPGAKGTRLEIGVKAPAGMDYIFLKKNLSFPAISGELIFTDGKLRLTDLSARLYGGRMRGEADISLKKEAPGYTASIRAEDVDFASVTKLYFNYDTSHGLMNGHFDFGGKGDPRSLHGRGAVKITDGDVFAIPMLGPLSGILNSIVPSMGYSVARNASSTFEIKDGVIETNDFLVEGKGFSMIGGGKLFFVDDKIDFNIRINAQGLPGVLLFPVSKLFEYSAESSLSKPVWKPRRLPSL